MALCKTAVTPLLMHRCMIHGQNHGWWLLHCMLFYWSGQNVNMSHWWTIKMQFLIVVGNISDIWTYLLFGQLTVLVQNKQSISAFDHWVLALCTSKLPMPVLQRGSFLGFNHHEERIFSNNGSVTWTVENKITMKSDCYCLVSGIKI